MAVPVDNESEYSFYFTFYVSYGCCILVFVVISLFIYHSHHNLGTCTLCLLYYRYIDFNNLVFDISILCEL